MLCAEVCQGTEPGPPATAPREVYPSLSAAIRLIVLEIAFGIFGGIVLGITASGLRGDRGFIVVVASADLAISFIVLFIGFRKTKATATEVFPLRLVRPTVLMAMALAVTGLGIVLSDLDNLLRTVLPAPESLVAMMTELSANLPAAVAIVVIGAPLVEELFFRGLVLRGLASRYTPTKAVVLSALLFAGAHLNLHQFVGAFVVGLLFGWCVIHTRSLIPGLFGHAVGNLIGVMGVAWEGFGIPGVWQPSNEVQFQPVWLSATGVILAAGGIWMLMREFGVSVRMFLPPTPPELRRS